MVYYTGVNHMNLFAAIIYGIFGTVTGSFLNVCILRIPEGESFISGRSRCPFCRRQLLARDMVPILSWICLGGKCRFCRSSLPLQYPAVEALTGLVFFLCRLSIGSGPQAVIMCLFGSLLITAAWIDARHLFIPDGIHLLILLLAAVSMMLPSAHRIGDRLAGAVLCGGFLALLNVLTKGGVGQGDIKLLGASGLLLGAKSGISAVFTAYVLAGLWYLIPLLRGKVNGKTQAPMAPFFALSLMIWGLWYDPIISWYMGLFLR